MPRTRSATRALVPSDAVDWIEASLTPDPKRDARLLDGVWKRLSDVINWLFDVEGVRPADGCTGAPAEEVVEAVRKNGLDVTRHELVMEILTALLNCTAAVETVDGLAKARPTKQQWVVRGRPRAGGRA